MAARGLSFFYLSTPSVRKGNNGENGERRKMTDENSGHYIIGSSQPLERRPLVRRPLECQPLERRTLVPIKMSLNMKMKTTSRKDSILDIKITSERHIFQ